MELDTALAEQELVWRWGVAMLPSKIDQSASVVFFADENDSEFALSGSNSAASWN